MSAALRIACAANFGVAMLKKTLAPESLSWMICEFDGRIGHFVGHQLGDDLAGVLAETFLEAVDIVLAEVVVLHQHADLGVLDVGQDVLGVDDGLGVVVGLIAHRPRELLGPAPLGGAGRDVELRHLLLVHVLLDRRVGGRAQRVEQAEHLVLLDELAHHLDRLGRAVAVVEGDEVDLAAVDAAGVVDALPVGFDALADHAVGGGRTAVGPAMAELDLGIGCTVVVLLLRERRSRPGEQRQRRRTSDKPTPTRNQRTPPFFENGAGVSSGIRQKRRPSGCDLPHYGYVATAARALKLYGLGRLKILARRSATCASAVSRSRAA